MSRIKDLSPKLSSLKSAEQELASPYTATPIGQTVGGLSMYSNSFKRGYGEKVFGADQRGIWLGGADFANAPFTVDMNGHIIATSAEFPSLVTISVFKQDAIPTSGAAGDLWVDTNDSNKIYRAAVAGANEVIAGEWEEVSDQRAVDAVQKSTDSTLSSVLTIGATNLKADGPEKRFIVNDGTNDRVLMGKLAGKF